MLARGKQYEAASTPQDKENRRDVKRPRRPRPRHNSSAVAQGMSGMEKSFDVVIKNARVVRPNKTAVDCLDIAVKDGKVAQLGPDIRAERAKAVFDAEELSGIPWMRRCAHAYRHLRTAGAGRRVREQGRGHGRRHIEPELHAHWPLLPQPRRALSRVHARSAQAIGRAVLGRLRLPSGPDRGRPHRRDGVSRHRARHPVVQDIHVLWRLRAARSFVTAERISHDRARTSVTISRISSSSCARRNA